MTQAKGLLLDFGGVISVTLFERHRLSERLLGLPEGTLTWRGPFDPESDALWRDMLELNCTTWSERPGQSRSECHGWSSAPIYELSAVTLGVRPTKPGYAAAEIRPSLGSLDSASGTVPTVRGEIAVSAVKKDGNLIVTVQAPAQIEKTLVFPDGHALVFSDEYLRVVRALPDA